MAVKRIYPADIEPAQHYLCAQLAAEEYFLTSQRWIFQTGALLVGSRIGREILCSNFPDPIPDRVLHRAGTHGYVAARIDRPKGWKTGLKAALCYQG